MGLAYGISVTSIHTYALKNANVVYNTPPQLCFFRAPPCTPISLVVLIY